MSTKNTTNKTRQRKAERRKAKQKQRQKQARGVYQTWIDEFNTTGEAIAGIYQHCCETVPTSDDGTRQMRFTSLGSRIYDFNNPDDTELIKLGIVLVFMYRSDPTFRPIAEMILHAFENEWTREMKDKWWDLIYENLGYRPDA